MMSSKIKTACAVAIALGAVALAGFSVYKNTRGTDSYSQSGIDDSIHQVMAKSDNVRVLPEAIHKELLSRAVSVGSAKGKGTAK